MTFNINEDYFLRKEIEKTKQIISENQYKLKCLEKIRDNNKVAKILKPYLEIEENRVNEDSFYEDIVFKNDCISEASDEIEGIHFSIIKKWLKGEKQC